MENPALSKTAVLDHLHNAAMSVTCLAPFKGAASMSARLDQMIIYLVTHKEDSQHNLNLFIKEADGLISQASALAQAEEVTRARLAKEKTLRRSPWRAPAL